MSNSDGQEIIVEFKETVKHTQGPVNICGFIFVTDSLLKMTNNSMISSLALQNLS